MNKYKFFWEGPFSNWFLSGFIVDDIAYNCGEQYMMYQKAVLFNDTEIADKILNETEPKKQKQLGRKVRNFNVNVWDSVRYDIVKKGLYHKFTQSVFLKSELLKYKEYRFVEASPYDTIWGIGFIEKDAMSNISKWGKNLLGKILTELSYEII